MPNAKGNPGTGRLIPVPVWPDFHPWPTVGGLRYLIHHAKDNGIDQCLVRVGRRVLIDEVKFFEWAKSC